MGAPVYLVERIASKPDADGEPIGPAMKHLGERAGRASPWSKLYQVDFPISSLAAALAQAELQLGSLPPVARARPSNIEGWELLIDTTADEWKVFHALPTSDPQW